MFDENLQIWPIFSKKIRNIQIFVTLLSLKRHRGLKLRAIGTFVVSMAIGGSSSSTKIVRIRDFIAKI